MKTALKISLSIVLVACLALGAAALLRYRHDINRSLERAALPEAVEYQEVASPVVTPNPSQPVTAPATPPPRAAAALPAEVNLAVPFTAQAPHGNWDPPYKEFCEEASALMAVYFIRSQPISGPDAAADLMQQIRAFEDERFGYYEDTTIAETALIIQEHFNFPDVEIIENPTVTDIKRAVASGRPVIVPAAGRLLGNPYYTPPGPLYHMLVVKGYTRDGRFITNDPGTRRGADFLYPEATLMNALHDWRPDGQIEQGRKAILIVG